MTPATLYNEFANQLKLYDAFLQSEELDEFKRIRIITEMARLHGMMQAITQLPLDQINKTLDYQLTVYESGRGNKYISRTQVFKRRRVRHIPKTYKS